MARLSPFFLTASAAFLRILRLTAFERDSTRSLGVSQGSSPYVTEKGNSLANSWVPTGGVNLSFFLALGVILGLGGTGGFLGLVVEVPGFIPWLAFTKLCEPRLHGTRLKIIVAGGDGPCRAHPASRTPNGWRTFLVQWRNLRPTALSCGRFQASGTSLVKSTCCSAALIKRVSSTNSCLYWSRNCKKAEAFHRGANHLRFHGATEAPGLTHATFITSVEFGPEGATCLSHHDGASSFDGMGGFGYGA